MDAIKAVKATYYSLNWKEDQFANGQGCEVFSSEAFRVGNNRFNGKSIGIKGSRTLGFVNNQAQKNKSWDVKIAFVRFGEMGTIKAVRETYFSLNRQVERFLQASDPLQNSHKENPSILGLISRKIIRGPLGLDNDQAQPNLKNSVGSTFAITSAREAIYVARKHVCGVHQTEVQFAIEQKWKRDQFMQSTNFLQAWHVMEQWRESMSNTITQEITKRQSLKNQMWIVKRAMHIRVHVLNQRLDRLWLPCITILMQVCLCDSAQIFCYRFLDGARINNGIDTRRARVFITR
ncbi:hypothetical protein PGT21_034193 [Puccinia graminis f. sp. tritici]|uniref:Uncharacterized protein n=1 Tax=Puccinia graminis f. sp. tritici TaxID=56615 RepID=A0A5B0NG94_PUCGR|nr:hypothetical protein PGT21_034193 [Puccinia graminis f. sp. tritici]